MDDPKRIVLDISSDEDVGWGERGVTCGGGGVRDDGDWISELLDEVRKTIDDSDELMVLGEVPANPQKVAKPLVKSVDNKEDDDDDDLVILDGDPDKPVTVENDGGQDSDDLCILGEKGQVACRDYPHPRHLCVKFPFDSTPHERHCDQCHCYVCDSVAPCAHWGSGAANDHCHATEKDEFWRAHRKRSKTKASNNVPPLDFGVGSTPVRPLPTLPSNPLVHNQEQPAGHPCPVTSISTPNSAMPMRTQVSGYHPSNIYQPQLVSPHPQRHNAGPAGNRLITRCVPFKRSRMVGGVFPVNRFGSNSSGNNYNYQFSRSRSLGSRWQDPGAGGNPVWSAFQDVNQANLGGVATVSVPNSPTWSHINYGLGNSAPLQPQMSSQMRNSSVNAEAASPYPQLSPQTFVDSNSMSTVPGTATQQRWGFPCVNLMPLQQQVASQPDAGRTCEVVMPSQPLVTSNCYVNYAENPASAQAYVFFQPDTSSDLNPLSYQQLSGGPSAIADHVLNDFGQGNQAENLPSSSGVSFNQDTCPMSQNIPSVPVEMPLEKAAVAINSQLPSSSNILPDGSEFVTLSPEEQSPFEYLEIPMSPGFNDLFSPESAPADSGLLYDI